MPWTKIGGPAKSIAAFDTTLCGLSPDGSAVYSNEGTPEHRTKIRGLAKNLIGGGSKLYAISPQTCDIWQYSGQGDQWTKLVPRVPCSWLWVKQSTASVLRRALAVGANSLSNRRASTWCTFSRTVFLLWSPTRRQSCSTQVFRESRTHHRLGLENC